MKSLSSLLVVVMLGGALWFWGRGGGAGHVDVVDVTEVADGGAVAGELAVAMDLPAKRARELAGSEPTVGSMLEAALVLRGHVVEAEDGATPIAGAEVGFDFGEFEGVPLHGRTTAGPDGAFEFVLDALPDVPMLVRDLVEFQVWARASGFREGHAAVSLAEVIAGDGDVGIELVRGRALSGRIVDAEGAPIGSAYVTLRMAKAGGAFEWALGACSADGTFRLAVKELDVLDLRVSAVGFVPGLVDLQRWDCVARPDVGDVVLWRGLAIACTLVCVHGEPLPGVEVTALSSDSASGGESLAVGARTDTAGAFRFEGLVPGAYLIRSEAQLLGEFMAGEVGLELVLKEHFLAVEVVDEEGRPLPGIDLATELGVLEDGVFDVGTTSSAMTWPPRGLVLHRLDHEDWNHAELMAQATGGQWVKAAVELSADVCMQKVRMVLPASVPMGSLRVALRDPGGREIRDFTVEAVPRDGAGGGKLLRGGGPFDWPVGAVRLSIGPGAQALFFPLRNVEVEVAEGQETLITRTVELGGRVSVEVQFEGAPSSPPRVRVWRVGADGVARRIGFLGPNGSTSFFSLEAGHKLIASEVLPAGTATFKFTAEGFADVTRNVNVVVGEVTPLKLTLPLQ